MILNQDKVPINLEDAILTLKEGLTDKDKIQLKNPKFSPAQVHFTVGMQLRNEWSLWDKQSILVRWFRTKYGIDHADDISGLILDCLYRDINNLPRREEELVKTYIEHWKKQK